MSYALREDGQGWRTISGPEDLLPGETLHETEPIIVPLPLTPQEEEKIKYRIIEEAIPKRDTLLMHLRWFYIKASEERNIAPAGPALVAAQAKVLAIDIAIASMQNIFNDPRVTSTTNGDVFIALKTVYLEIFQALAISSPTTYFALKDLDPL